MARPTRKTQPTEFTPEEQKQEFLTELLDGYKKWSSIGNKEYAELYLVTLNQFTNVEIPE